jgi:DDE superfamily endonuclease
MRIGFGQEIDHLHGPHVITYSATLDVPEETATLLTDLLVAERLRRGTGVGARAASARDQAVLVLRWFREDTPVPTLARDAGVSTATGYRYLHEGINILAAHAPDLHSVLEAGSAEGWSHVTVDGTLIRTDRCRAPHPDTGHDLWFSGKHRAHGGNVQVVCDPEGFPVAVSDVQPGSVHDLAAVRATGFLGALYAAAALLGLPTLADKGYEGAGAGIVTPIKGRRLHPDNAARNQLIGCLRAPGERGIALLKTRWKALGRIRLCPQRIGAIVAAALVLATAERPIH